MHPTHKIQTMIGALAVGLILSSCSIAHIENRTSPGSQVSGFVLRNEPNQPLLPGRERVDYPIEPAKGPIVLLAISGGGSRSAYYAARVMQELACIPAPDGQGSMLDKVRVLSTVSAGSLAAAYYVAHYDERHDPGFYDKFKNSMAANLQWRTYGHMAMFPPLALQLAASSITRTDLLANEIEKLLGKRITFDDLRVQETRAADPSPALVVNGTVYNSGQRLVMTNLPPTRFPSIGGRGMNASISQNDSKLLFNLVQPITFSDFGSDIGPFRVSQALAASAAYPIVLAPVRLRTYPENVPPELLARTDPAFLASRSIYVADGGLVENEGVDALLSVMKTMPKDQPTLVLVVEASQRMETIKVSEHKIWDPISVIRRISDIGSMRPLALYGAVAGEFHNPDKLRTVVIRMEGYDEETEKTLRNIPTSFKLTNAHRDALDYTASQNVAHMRDALVAAYDQLAKGKKVPKVQAAKN